MRVASALLLFHACGFEQTAGIAVLRMTQDFFHGALLDTSPLMHDEECVAKLLHERDVMTDEEKRELFLFFNAIKSSTISCSAKGSKALVISSQTRISGFSTSALAMAAR